MKHEYGLESLSAGNIDTAIRKVHAEYAYYSHELKAFRTDNAFTSDEIRKTHMYLQLRIELCALHVHAQNGLAENDVKITADGISTNLLGAHESYPKNAWVAAAKHYSDMLNLIHVVGIYPNPFFFQYNNNLTTFGLNLASIAIAAAAPHLSLIFMIYFHLQSNKT
jgi:hypothetical protein